jgi:hypothetical protein
VILWSSGQESLPGPVDVPVCKPHLSIAELAELTPWTAQAIRTMMSRGLLQSGVRCSQTSSLHFGAARFSDNLVMLRRPVTSPAPELQNARSRTKRSAGSRHRD